MHNTWSAVAKERYVELVGRSPSYQAGHHSAGYNPPMPQSISVQGCSLSFAEQGSGEPVVFIQGVGLHGERPKPGQKVDCTPKLRHAEFR